MSDPALVSDADAAQPGSGAPSDSPGFLLWRATLRWQRSITAALRPLELTHVQFVLLAVAWWLSGPPGGEDRSLTQRQLATLAEVDSMMTSQVLRALDRRGLIRRTADPTDGRGKRVTITEAGRGLVELAITIVEDADKDFFGNAVDPRELLEMLRQLGR